MGTVNLSPVVHNPTLVHGPEQHCVSHEMAATGDHATQPDCRLFLGKSALPEINLVLTLGFESTKQWSCAVSSFITFKGVCTVTLGK